MWQAPLFVCRLALLTPTARVKGNPIDWQNSTAISVILGSLVSFSGSSLFVTSFSYYTSKQKQLSITRISSLQLVVCLGMPIITC